MTQTNIFFLSLEGQQFGISVRSSLLKKLGTIRHLLFGFCAICFLLGLVFFVIGAKPVLGFMGFEIILICILYKYTENNAKRETTLIFGQQKLIIKERDQGGNISYTGFDVNKVKVRLESSSWVDPNLVVFQGKKNKNVCNFISRLEKENLLKIINHQIKAKR